MNIRVKCNSVAHGGELLWKRPANGPGLNEALAEAAMEKFLETMAEAANRPGQYSSFAHIVAVLERARIDNLNGIR